jgi:hypothetical protein
MFTNTRSAPASISLRKMLFPAFDLGRFDLLVGDTVVKAAAGNDDFGDTLVGPGAYTIKEVAAAGTGTTLAAYTSSIDCMLNGGPGPHGLGPSLQVTVAATDFLDCTIHNVRNGRITVKKRLVPSTDPGRFDLKVGEAVVKAAAGDGGAGSLYVAPGMHTIAETAAPGTSLSNYDSSIACTLNGGPGPSGAGTSIQASVGSYDQLTCTITNRRS